MTVAVMPQTIAEFFARSVSVRGAERALGYIRDGELRWLTWHEVAQSVFQLAGDLQGAGLVPLDRVAHVSENRYEWIIADLAIQLIRAVHVPIHVTLSGQQIAEQIKDSGAKVVIVSNRDLLVKFASNLEEQPPVLYHDDFLLDCDPCIADVSTKLQTLALTHRGSNVATSLATILYTSGTTGRPRGVMLSHGNLASNAAAVCDAHRVQSEQTMLCILPLSHIYARTCDLYSWIVSGSKLVIGESRETLLRDCQLVRPTALNAVPFVYQRIMNGIINSNSDDQAAALRRAFGGCMERLFCGGAPLGANVETWYEDQGLPLLAGYGLTESSPVIAIATLWSRRFGTVGQAIPGIEISTAADGELLTRGPHVMQGYWHDEAATVETIDVDGWLRTGDLAAIDGEGFVTILGRKKELIVLSTGKKVCPTHVESMLSASPLIEQAAVFGEGECGLTALIVPAACELARSEENEPRSEEQFARFRAEIDRCLTHASREEQIHRVVLLKRPFLVERGELTAKMSLCREVIARNFAAELAAEPGSGLRTIPKRQY